MVGRRTQLRRRAPLDMLSRSGSGRSARDSSDPRAGPEHRAQRAQVCGRHRRKTSLDQFETPHSIGFNQLVRSRHHKARQQRKFSWRAIVSRFFRTFYAEIVATARKPCAAWVAHITPHGSVTDTEAGASGAINDIEGHGSLLVALYEAVCTTRWLRLANVSR